MNDRWKLETAATREPVTHSVENLGDNDIHNLIVELKTAAAPKR